MTVDSKWAVTLHRDGEVATTVGYQGPDAVSAIRFVAKDLGLDVDDDGNVSGDPQIVRLTVEEDPDMPIQLEEQ